MKNKIRMLVCLAVGATFLFEGSLPASARSRGRAKPVVTKGKPAIEYTGTITDVNAAGHQITVSGSSNGGSKGAPGGSAVFEVDPACFIQGVGGHSGSFSDLQAGQSVSISYSSGLGEHLNAKSIRTAAAAPASAQTTGKKK